MTSVSVEPAEVAKFEAMAAEWWDPDGKFRPLHKFNPVRLAYIRDQAAARFQDAGHFGNGRTWVRCMVQVHIGEYGVKSVVSRRKRTAVRLFEMHLQPVRESLSRHF